MHSLFNLVWLLGFTFIKESKVDHLLSLLSRNNVGNGLVREKKGDDNGALKKGKLWKWKETRK